MSRKCIDFRDLAVFIRCEFSDTWSQKLRTDEGGDSAYHVDGTGAGKIMKAYLGEPAAAPDPVCLNGINQGGNHRRIDTVG